MTNNGVVIREAHLQIDLRVYGYGRERLDLAPTPSNIRYAEKLRAEILGKIERGTFSLAEYFPDSPRAKMDAPSLAFSQVAAEWLKVKAATIQHSTLDHYQQTVGAAYFDSVRDTRMDSLDFRAIMKLTAALPANPKTFNNFATVLRQILEYAFKAKLIREPLHEHVMMRRRQKAQPDPFTLPEALLVLEAMATERARLYYEVAFFTGMRPSELIALRWRNVNLARGQLTVTTALTRGKEKDTKTSVVRTLELTSRALAALKAQHKLTGQIEHVFTDEDGSIFTTTDEPLRGWWKPAMLRAAVRTRDARQTRHTFATTCLMAGITPGWVATQLGHAPEMFFRVYSRWIVGADHGAEKRKLDAHLYEATVPKDGSKAETGPGQTPGQTRRKRSSSAKLSEGDKA
ncbi:site-specific integrase [Variovorax atrisoli]|uniref:site-specific integrase n=1 Tax=Variovorax atrisoli TaxID=3394203 RepID=UPI001609DD92|nr:site-specific integrase [Variovorax sp. BK613]MBB3642572.1 integrase [Variovorax sp. BK613]